MDSLSIANSDESETAKQLRIICSTAFEDAADVLVRCFLAKMKYNLTYSPTIEKKLKKLEKEWKAATWEELETNYQDNREAIEESIEEVETAVTELVAIGEIQIAAPSEAESEEKSESGSESESESE
jgi:mRNA-degrading endonuclease RelE of RelBE toxin-antitoxin system